MIRTNIGYILLLLGAFGGAGAIETDGSVARPLILMAIGAVLLFWGICDDKKKKVHDFTRSASNSRPYFLH